MSKETKTDPTVRLAWGAGAAVQRYGYLWALVRENEGKEWRDWGENHKDLSKTDHDGWEILWRCHGGIAQGIQNFAKRLEESSLEELLAEERLRLDHFWDGEAGEWDMRTAVKQTLGMED